MLPLERGVTPTSSAAPLAALKSLGLPSVRRLQVQHLEARKGYESTLLRLETTEVSLEVGVLLVDLSASL